MGVQVLLQSLANVGSVLHPIGMAKVPATSLGRAASQRGGPVLGPASGAHRQGAQSGGYASCRQVCKERHAWSPTPPKHACCRAD
jgi:hypothetical protein